MEPTANHELEHLVGSLVMVQLNIEAHLYEVSVQATSIHVGAGTHIHLCLRMEVLVVDDDELSTLAVIHMIPVFNSIVTAGCAGSATVCC